MTIVYTRWYRTTEERNGKRFPNQTMRSARIRIRYCKTIIFCCYLFLCFCLHWYFCKDLFFADCRFGLCKNYVQYVSTDIFTAIYSCEFLFLAKITKISWFILQYPENHKLSLVVRKPAFCICENKDADQLRGNREADQRLCFRHTDSTITLLPKYEISSL